MVSPLAQEAAPPGSSALQDPNQYSHPDSEPRQPSSGGHTPRETGDSSSPTRQILDLYISRLAVDPSRWVRTAALQQCGAVIAALPPDQQQLPQLVELFCSSSVVQGAEAAATLLTCAESFALVVCKVGGSWSCCVSTPRCPRGGGEQFFDI